MLENRSLDFEGEHGGWCRLTATKRGSCVITNFLHQGRHRPHQGRICTQYPAGHSHSYQTLEYHTK